MTEILAACGGFLIAILWMDLMFDVQIFRRTDAAGAVESIADYYRHVTTEAWPMNRLIGSVMFVLLVTLTLQIAYGSLPPWSRIVTPLLAVPPIGLAAVRIFPDAVRLGSRRDPEDVQERLARRIARAHLYCIGSMGLFVAVEILLA